MPTLNPSYNELLKKWSKNAACSPECEECGCDLTGKEVIDTGTNWVCCDCAQDQPEPGLSDGEERDSERRQMGVTNG